MRKIDSLQHVSQKWPRFWDQDMRKIKDLKRVA